MHRLVRIPRLLIGAVGDGSLLFNGIPGNGRGGVARRLWRWNVVACAALFTDDPQKMQRVGIARLLFQNRAIVFFGGLEIARPVMAGGALQQLVIGVLECRRRGRDHLGIGDGVGETIGA